MKTILSFFVIFVASSLGHVEQKVLGGILAQENEFPHQVALLEMGTHHCGGVVIDELHVLTAATCLEHNPYATSSLVIRIICLTKISGKIMKS